MRVAKLSTRMMCAVALGVLGIGVIPSCATTSVAGTDSNTHWLEQCRTDKDCGSLVCQCGACTQPCSATSECKGLGAKASCATASCVTDTTVCVEACTTTADCPRDGRALACQRGQCVPERPDGGLNGGSCPSTIRLGDPCAAGDACHDCVGGGVVGYYCNDGRLEGTTFFAQCGPDAGADGGSGAP
jgi:hypothetical protein